MTLDFRFFANILQITFKLSSCTTDRTAYCAHCVSHSYRKNIGVSSTIFLIRLRIWRFGIDHIPDWFVFRLFSIEGGSMVEYIS